MKVLPLKASEAFHPKFETSRYQSTIRSFAECIVDNSFVFVYNDRAGGVNDVSSCR